MLVENVLKQESITHFENLCVGVYLVSLHLKSCEDLMDLTFLMIACVIIKHGFTTSSWHALSTNKFSSSTKFTLLTFMRTMYRNFTLK